MSIIQKLATSLGRRDEVLNQELALLLASTEDKEAIRELIENLEHKNKNIRSDCMKVLYEIGAQKPELISPYHETLVSLLASKNNRLVWGAMTALDSISNINPELVYQSLPQILDAADKGSVISKDHAVSILIKLAGNKDYHDEASVLLLGQMSSCPPNQLPMYAEAALPVISAEFKAGFLELLRSRMGEFEKESKRKRVEKVAERMKEQVGRMKNYELRITNYERARMKDER